MTPREDTGDSDISEKPFMPEYGDTKTCTARQLYGHDGVSATPVARGDADTIATHAGGRRITKPGCATSVGMKSARGNLVAKNGKANPRMY